MKHVTKKKEFTRERRTQDELHTTSTGNSSNCKPSNFDGANVPSGNAGPVRCALAESVGAVENLITQNYQAIRSIAAKQCRAANIELAHVEGFNADDVTQDICLQIWLNWQHVPVEPGFFSFVKTLVSHRVADLWKKHQTRTNAFTAHEEEVMYV